MAPALIPAWDATRRRPRSSERPPAPGGNCNIVDEHTVFTFGNGTILIHSHHKDCATVGLRIDTHFDVTGGTGAFAGATGGGHQFSAVNDNAPAATPVIYNGTITF